MEDNLRTIVESKIERRNNSGDGKDSSPSAVYSPVVSFNGNRPATIKRN